MFEDKHATKFTVLMQCILQLRKKEVKVKVRVKQSHYRPGVAQRIPGS